MPKILLQRTNDFRNLMRDYQIYIDGQKAGTISNKESKEFEVTSGQHTIIAEIDWCSSQSLSFDIKDSETKNVSVKSFRGSYWLFPFMMGVLVLHFILHFSIHFEHTLFLLLPAWLYLVYYMTFARKKYLELTEL